MENHLELKQKSIKETLTQISFREYSGLSNKPIVLVAPPRGNKELDSYISWLNKEGFKPKVLQENSQVIYAPLILCGGADIGKNPSRDSRELEWIRLALECGQPIIGICKGMQILNYYFGGEVKNLDNLILEKHSADDFEIDEDHSEKKSNMHSVVDLDGSTMLVNSRHHQYCSKIADNFKVQHVSLGCGHIPESIEDSKNKIWAVQWHPERYEMDDNTYPLNKLFT